MKKTYTNRHNARRAGIAAGNPPDRVEVTVHKSAEGVRFGWRLEAVPQSVGKRSLPVSAAARDAPATRSARLEQNGVKRPTVGGLCNAVWTWLDVHPDASIKDLRLVATRHSWNINNAACEFYTWRKFNGISGRLKRETD